MKILHRCRVSPSPNSVETTSLPLTYFDIPWLLCPPIQRLFLYESSAPCSSNLDFTRTTLPLLIDSLSLSLRQFFPFAADLILPPPPKKPTILYSNGSSGLLLTVAESDRNFAEFVADDARDARLLHPLVPVLPPPRVSDGTWVAPIMAIQVTLFPNEGICIGVQFNHVAADGRSFNHFMKLWASIHKVRGDPTRLGEAESDSIRPFHDRSVIKDPNGIEPILLKDWWSWVSEQDTPIPNRPSLSVADKIRITLVLRKSQIESLKQQVLDRLGVVGSSPEEPLHMSSFVVASAFVWVCLLKSRSQEASKGDNELCHFCFVADCRNRRQHSMPTEYFGNYLDIRFVEMKRESLEGESGISAAVKAIGGSVREMEVNGGLGGAARWLRDWNTLSQGGDLVTVAGSPRLRVYDTNFGWGKPRKCHVVHIDLSSGTIALAENREDEGGLEIGLALPRAAMEIFVHLFEQSLTK